MTPCIVCVVVLCVGYRLDLWWIERSSKKRYDELAWREAERIVDEEYMTFFLDNSDYER